MEGKFCRGPARAVGHTPGPDPRSAEARPWDWEEEVQDAGDCYRMRTALEPDRGWWRPRAARMCVRPVRGKEDGQGWCVWRQRVLLGPWNLTEASLWDLEFPWEWRRLHSFSFFFGMDTSVPCLCTVEAGPGLAQSLTCTSVR